MLKQVMFYCFWSKNNAKLIVSNMCKMMFKVRQNTSNVSLRIKINKMSGLVL